MSALNLNLSKREDAKIILADLRKAITSDYAKLLAVREEMSALVQRVASLVVPVRYTLHTRLPTNDYVPAQKLAKSLGRLNARAQFDSLDLRARYLYFRLRGTQGKVAGVAAVGFGAELAFLQSGVLRQYSLAVESALLQEMHLAYQLNHREKCLRMAITDSIDGISVHGELLRVARII